MFTVDETIHIHAPLDRLWQLSTRIEIVQQTLGMHLVDGVTQGFITADSRVVWSGWKFGLPTSHHTRITAFAPPHTGQVGDRAARHDGQRVAWFDDSQERGRFATFCHQHLFRDLGNGEVELSDRVEFSLPFGPLGRLAARLLLTSHIRKLARKRFQLLKQLAESDGWRRYITT